MENQEQTLSHREIQKRENAKNLVKLLKMAHSVEYSGGNKITVFLHDDTRIEFKASAGDYLTIVHKTGEETKLS